METSPTATSYASLHAGTFHPQPPVVFNEGKEQDRNADPASSNRVDHYPTATFSNARSADKLFEVAYR